MRALNESPMDEKLQKQYIINHLKRVVCGLNFNYVEEISTFESAEEISIKVKFSNVQGWGDCLGRGPYFRD